ncbi:MAG TPA: CHASE3 domain-containing protein [Xanthobacteraceae bacterium]
MLQPYVLASCCFVLAFLKLGATLLLVASQSDAEWVAHTLKVETRISSLFAVFQSVDSRQRDYLLTGDPNDLADYRREVDRLAPEVAALRAETADNAVQQQNIEALTTVMTRVVDELNDIVRLHDSGADAEARQIVHRGKERVAMEEFRSIASRMKDEEERLLALRTSKAAQTGMFIFVANIMGTALIVAIAFLALLAARRLVARDALLASDLRARKFAYLLEAAPDAIVIVNQAGDIVLVNSQTERLFGYARSELLGRKIEILLPQRFHATHRSQFVTAPQARPASLQVFGQRKDGAEFPAEITLNHLQTEEGRLISSAIRDTTERARYESALREKNIELQRAVNELDAFTYSVSHDLRAPLRAIDGFSQILLKQYGPAMPDEPREYLQLVRDNSVQMGRLADGLLTFSRLGRQPLDKQIVVPAPIVEQVLRDARRQAEGRCVSVSVGELPPLWGDPTLVKQVFVNLIDNAFKYTAMREQAVIEVGSREIDGEQVFFVRDNGAGFDMKYAGKLFGVFQRLHRAEDFAGTGVGLAIVHRIVERHGGRVWTDAAVDRGATFYFTTEVPHDA